jgi:hypothetical protein
MSTDSAVDPTVDRLRRRGDAIIGRELTRLAGRAQALGPQDLARLRTLPHRAAEVDRLFADPDPGPGCP